jgi:DNA ligase (NAD+)
MPPKIKIKLPKSTEEPIETELTKVEKPKIKVKKSKKEEKINPYIEIIEDPLKIIKKLKLEEIELLMNHLEEAYEIGAPFVPDKIYDDIKDYFLSEKAKLGKVKIKIGSKPTRDKVKLPIFMGSMDKIDPNSSQLRSFFTKYPGEKVISMKLDGISMLIDARNLSNIKAYTRGDGEEGQDVSWIIPYLKLEIKEPCIVRGEAIFSKTNWAKIKHIGKNPRNSMAGMINRLRDTDPEIMKYAHFVAYEFIDPSVLSVYLPNSIQMEKLEENGFIVVPHKKGFKTNLKSATLEKITEELSDILMEWKETGDYEMDGIIITDNGEHERNTEGNPDYGKAFKINQAAKETIVKGVEWNPSKDGYLKPVILVETVLIDGNSYNRVTGNNARFINNNGIGKGAKITIVRSKDVIPKVVEVIEPTEPEFPSEYEWKWANDVDIELVDKENDSEVQLRRMLYFINTMKIDFIKEGTIRKLIENGITTIDQLCHLTKGDFLELDGIKETSASKFYEALKQGMAEAPIYRWLTATCEMRGIGEKRMKTIVKSIPEIETIPVKDIDSLRPKIEAIEGFGGKTTTAFLEGIKECLGFVRELMEEFSEPVESIDEPVGTTLSGQSFVFSGFRDDELKTKIEKLGGEVRDSVNKGLTILVVKSKDKASGKIEKAEKLGIPIMTKEEFLSHVIGL